VLQFQTVITEDCLVVGR